MRYFHTSEVPIYADSPAQVHKPNRFFVHLAGCSSGERHVPPKFRLQAHDLRLGLRCREHERRANSHDHLHNHLSAFQLSRYSACIVSVQHSSQHLGRLLLALLVDSSGPCPPLFFSSFLLPLELPDTVHSDCISGEAFLLHVQHRREQILNSSGANTHPCQTPCSTPNISEHSPSSNRTHAPMPSWNWRMTPSILGGMQKRAKTVYLRMRSTDS